MGVVLLLVVIWAVVLVPPAVRAHTARKEAFLVSFGRPPEADPPPPSRGRSQQVERRRRIAGGLLAAMVATLLVGLLPTFRVFLVIHLFLLDSFLAYIALLAHRADRAARARRPQPELEPAPVVEEHAFEPRRRRRAIPRPAILTDLGPVAPAG